MRHQSHLYSSFTCDTEADRCQADRCLLIGLADLPKLRAFAYSNHKPSSESAQLSRKAKFITSIITVSSLTPMVHLHYLLEPDHSELGPKPET